MKLRAVFRFIRETNNSLLIILPGLLFSLGLAQFAMILFVFFQSPKANLLLLAIVVFNLLIFSLFIVFIIHITTAFIQPLYEIWQYSISPDSKKRLSDNPFLQRVEEQIVAQTDEIIKSQFGNITNLKALQSQINPHFLYNTLDSLRGELYMCDMPNLAQMVETLSELFRYSISQKEPLISLEAEIDNTEKYIRIMQFRFPNKFVLYKRFDDETDEILGMQVPKMILQPIVENSINHGLEAKIGPGRIFIDITHTERTVCIRVDDDGVGIPADKLDSINTQLSKNESNCAADSVRGMGLALFNINSRIRLLYGEDYGVSVASSVGKGTQVQIMLPLSKE